MAAVPWPTLLVCRTRCVCTLFDAAYTQYYVEPFCTEVLNEVMMPDLLCNTNQRSVVTPEQCRGTTAGMQKVGPVLRRCLLELQLLNVHASGFWSLAETAQHMVLPGSFLKSTIAFCHKQSCTSTKGEETLAPSRWATKQPDRCGYRAKCLQSKMNDVQDLVF